MGLETKWDDIIEAYGLSNQEMFDLFNTNALDEANTLEKTIRFFQNPLDWSGTSLDNEWDHLYNHHGYTNLIEIGGYWYANK